jgi:hypothetical protein
MKQGGGIGEMEVEHLKYYVVLVIILQIVHEALFLIKNLIEQRHCSAESLIFHLWQVPLRYGLWVAG